MRVAPMSSAADNTIRLQNMARQPPTRAISPPTIGAATVATPLTAAIIDIIFVNSFPLYLSVAMLLERTTPPDPARPWKSLMMMNSWTLAEKMQPNVDIRNRAIAHIKGRFRPYLSLTGPNISWPTASPTRPVVRPNCTLDTGQSNQSCMAGNTGTYMSMTKGPKALNAPKYTRTNVFLPDMWLSLPISRYPHL